MTFEETRALLLDLRAAKRRANAIKARLSDLESDAESINSALNGGMPSGNIMRSRVEELALRIESEREKHIAALEAYFLIEDQLSEALETLDPIERDVIIGCYMDGKSNWKVAQSIGYEERTIRRKKSKAIQKIASKL